MSNLNPSSPTTINLNTESESIFVKQQRNVQRRHVQDLELRFTKQIFHEFDADGSDSIDIDELRLVMEAMGHEMTDSQLRELLEQVDINKSGDLSFSEFVQLIALWKAASQFKLFESDSPTIQDQRIQEALEPELFLSDSWWRIAWDALMYLVCVYSFFMITYILVTLDIQDDDISSVLIRNTLPVDITAAGLWLCDIVLRFFTAQRVSYQNPTDRRVLDTVKEVAIHHLSNIYFYIDLIALVPLHRVSTDEGLLWLGFNTMFRIFKVPRLFQRSQRMQLSATYVYVHFYLVPVTHGLMGALIFVHLLSCFWTLVQRAAVANGAPSFSLGSLSKSASQGSSTVNYVSSLYFILSTLTTTGYGDIYILDSPGRIVAACVLCVVGTLTTGIVIGNIVSTLSKTNIHTDRENKLVQTLAVLNYFNVPGPLANEILNFQNHLLLHNLGDSHQGLIRGLPDEMQKNISLFSRINLVSECVLFTNAHQGTKVALAEAIRPTVFRPDESVVIQGEVGDCMYFVSYGVLGMKMAKKDIFFQRGNYFGEIALLSRGAKRTSTVKALTYCDLFRLTRDIFRTIVARFPKFRVAISDECHKRKDQMMAGLLKAGDTEGYEAMKNLKFMHEEEEERAQALLNATQGSIKNGAHANSNSTSPINHTNQQHQTAPSDLRDGSFNNGNNTPLDIFNNNTNNNNNNNNNSRRAGSNESPSGERDTPEGSVRTDIKSCSNILTDLHAMVHSMTHGFAYSGPSEIPTFISQQQQIPNSNSSFQQQQQQQQQGNNININNNSSALIANNQKSNGLLSVYGRGGSHHSQPSSNNSNTPANLLSPPADFLLGSTVANINNNNNNNNLSSLSGNESRRGSSNNNNNNRNSNDPTPNNNNNNINSNEQMQAE